MEIKLGQITNGKALGKTNQSRWRYFIWTTCVDCGLERWVNLVKGKPKSIRCKECHNKHLRNYVRGENHPRWLGGRNKDLAGYIVITLQPDDFFFSMADPKRRVMEHRLVMAKSLNRCLLSWEVVHHKNGIKDDNRIENLQLLPTAKQHLPSMAVQRQLAQMEQRITLLEAENILLKSQIEIIGEGVLESKDG